MNITQTAIQKYVSAFATNRYHIRLVHFDTGKAIKVDYSPEQLLRATAYLMKKNMEGFNIYCRPIGYEFVLLDDLHRDILGDVAEIKPCLLIETSPKNFQVWLTLANVPDNRERAREICRELAVRFNGDLGSAKPDQVGRLPGFTNRKAKYQQPNGLYPFVILHRSECRVSTFHPGGG